MFNMYAQNSKLNIYLYQKGASHRSACLYVGINTSFQVNLDEMRSRKCLAATTVVCGHRSELMLIIQKKICQLLYEPGVIPFTGDVSGWTSLSRKGISIRWRELSLSELTFILLFRLHVFCISLLALCSLYSLGFIAQCTQLFNSYYCFWDNIDFHERLHLRSIQSTVVRYSNSVQPQSIMFTVLLPTLSSISSPMSTDSGGG